MLPMVVTSTLAKGAVLLSRRKVIVKRLDAIQNFGAMDVLCTDKTGTLTQDHIVLQRHRHGQDSLQGARIRLAQQPLPDRPQEPPRRGRAGPRR
jgi:Mg2+-importing ATPase